MIASGIDVGLMLELDTEVYVLWASSEISLDGEVLVEALVAHEEFELDVQMTGGSLEKKLDRAKSRSSNTALSFWAARATVADAGNGYSGPV